MSEKQLAVAATVVVAQACIEPHAGYLKHHQARFHVGCGGQTCIFYFLLFFTIYYSFITVAILQIIDNSKDLLPLLSKRKQ